MTTARGGGFSSCTQVAFGFGRSSSLTPLFPPVSLYINFLSAGWRGVAIKSLSCWYCSLPEVFSGDIHVMAAAPHFGLTGRNVI